MWLFTTKGFFSIVEHNDDADKVLIRARCEPDIIWMSNQLGATWTQTPRADYPYRITAPKERFANLLFHIAENIDYPNFKQTIAGDNRRAVCYNRIWSDAYIIDDRMNGLTLDEEWREMVGLDDA